MGNLLSNDVKSYIILKIAESEKIDRVYYLRQVSKNWKLFIDTKFKPTRTQCESHLFFQEELPIMRLEKLEQIGTKTHIINCFRELHGPWMEKYHGDDILASVRFRDVYFFIVQSQKWSRLYRWMMNIRYSNLVIPNLKEQYSPVTCLY